MICAPNSDAVTRQASALQVSVHTLHVKESQKSLKSLCTQKCYYWLTPAMKYLLAAQPVSLMGLLD